MTRRLHIVDVFTDRPCAGNQLAVVIGAAGLNTRQMQAFAREMNFAETAFVMSEQLVDGAWPVRIYTPQREVPFAGHPSLGTAHVIRHVLLGARSERVLLDLPIGRVPVVVERHGRRELYWMRQPKPTFGARLPRKAVAAALGLSSADLNARQPILEVSTGLAHLIVPVTTLKALERIRVDRDAFLEILRPLEANGILAFAPGARDRASTLTARVFDDANGIVEDAATGSGNGCLAAWLVETEFLADDAIDLSVAQGVTLGRPSELHLRAMRTSQGIEVRVGGGVVDIARGVIVAARLG